MGNIWLHLSEQWNQINCAIMWGFFSVFFSFFIYLFIFPNSVRGGNYFTIILNMTGCCKCQYHIIAIWIMKHNFCTNTHTNTTRVVGKKTVPTQAQLLFALMYCRYFFAGIYWHTLSIAVCLCYIYVLYIICWPHTAAVFQGHSFNWWWNSKYQITTPQSERAEQMANCLFLCVSQAG